MIRKSTKLLGVMIVLVGLLSSCTLAVPEQQVSAGTGDQLVGVFVTQKDLNKEHKGRIEAEIVRDRNNEVEGFDFDGIEGMGCYSVIVDGGQYSLSDDGLSKNAHMILGRETRETTIYVDRVYKGNFYVNPVYQKAEGELYLLCENAELLMPVIGGRRIVTITNNSLFRLGDIDGIRILDIKIGIEEMLSAKVMTARQYDEKGTLLSSQAIDLEKLAKGDMTLKKVANMAYAVVEWDTGKEKKYSITEKSEAGLGATVYAHNSKGIAIERSIYFK